MSLPHPIDAGCLAVLGALATPSLRIGLQIEALEQDIATFTVTRHAASVNWCTVHSPAPHCYPHAGAHRRAKNAA